MIPRQKIKRWAPVIIASVVTYIAVAELHGWASTIAGIVGIGVIVMLVRRVRRMSRAVANEAPTPKPGIEAESVTTQFHPVMHTVSVNDFSPFEHDLVRRIHGTWPEIARLSGLAITDPDLTRSNREIEADHGEGVVGVAVAYIVQQQARKMLSQPGFMLAGTTVLRYPIIREIVPDPTGVRVLLEALPGLDLAAFAQATDRIEAALGVPRIIAEQPEQLKRMGTVQLRLALRDTLANAFTITDFEEEMNR